MGTISTGSRGGEYLQKGQTGRRKKVKAKNGTRVKQYKEKERK